MAHRSDAIVVFTEIDSSCASVRITGDLDLQAEPELLGALSKLDAAEHRAVVLELEGTAFVGSALPNFLVRVRHSVGPEANISVRHPSLLARRILELTGLPYIAVLSGDVFVSPEGSTSP